ncbi:2-hydroxyacid dehydrogenase [Tenacibaculum jejuense]|uniref:Phosphoglycerate dehydrogenase-like oxidoreductase n=1 Tax=Tenacibaculum jejuense TaxID=584609 RepID=A0A238U5U9_9FLAO|nr:glyoxylate/hydroxypyruvate reductase A [Tenacibaculum jejuense]SNR13864.1 Phosphoglycerate dehydrogenase-like oxidoreductase [Tenacibaculum jejuense]
MSIVICFNNKDPKPWQETLQTKLPDTTIEIYPNVTDPKAVTFALCWKPEPNILAQFPNVKVVQSVGASVEHIIQSQDLASDYVVTRIVDNRLSEDMFEFILTGILSHLKRFAEYQKTQKEKQWQQKPYKTIQNTSIGILGLGKIGTHVATKLAQIGFKVKAWSRSEKTLVNVSCFHGNDGLTDVLQNTDILINILPLTSATENILNLENLSQLNKNGYLINVGRGEHLVENDLLRLLNNQHLSGALLDVFRTEPLPIDHPFWEHKNIIITPHIAAITNIETASDIVVSNYKNLLNEKELINVVSIQKGY